MASVLFHTPVLVKESIAINKLSRMIAYELTTKERIYHVEGTPEQLCESLDKLLPAISGPFRLECGVDGDSAVKGGQDNSAGTRSPFVWRMMGTMEDERSNPAPVLAHYPTPQAPAKIPDGYKSPLEYQQGLELEALRHQLKMLSECEHGVHVSKPCTLCAQLDDDDDDEPPVEGFQIEQNTMTFVKEMITLIRTPSVPKNNATAPITGNVPEPSEMSDEDRATWAAICQMRSQYPDHFKNYRDQLLTEYGPKE